MKNKTFLTVVQKDGRNPEWKDMHAIHVACAEVQNHRVQIYLIQGKARRLTVQNPKALHLLSEMSDRQQIFMFKKLEPDGVWHLCFKWLIDHQNSQRLIYSQPFNRPVVAAPITTEMSICWQKHPENTGRICSGLLLFERWNSCSWLYECVFGFFVVEVLQLVFVGSGAMGGCAAIDVRGVYSRKVQIEAVFQLNEGGMAGGAVEPTHPVSW